MRNYFFIGLWLCSGCHDSTNQADMAMNLANDASAGDLASPLPDGDTLLDLGMADQATPFDMPVCSSSCASCSGCCTQTLSTAGSSPTVGCPAFCACSLTFTGTNTNTINCAASSSCQATATNDNNTLLTCGTGATCALFCSNGHDCTVSCGASASCLLQCTAPINNCSLIGCTPTACPNGAQVCGRACP